LLDSLGNQAYVAPAGKVKVLSPGIFYALTVYQNLIGQTDAKPWWNGRTFLPFV
jgi:hypothetical protein